MIGVNPTRFIIVSEWAREPLTVFIPADDALYGSFESYVGKYDQMSDSHFIATQIELSPEKGISLELPSGKPIRYKPVYWTQAWYALGLEQRLYPCSDVTQKLILELCSFRPGRKHGQRKGGRTDKDVIDYLINLVHAYRFAMEGEQNVPISLREAARAVTYDAETQDPRYPFLMPDDGNIPWPTSWTNDGATADTEQGIERLRKRADRDRPKRD